MGNILEKILKTGDFVVIHAHVVLRTEESTYKC